MQSNHDRIRQYILVDKNWNTIVDPSLQSQLNLLREDKENRKIVLFNVPTTAPVNTNADKFILMISNDPAVHHRLLPLIQNEAAKLSRSYKMVKQ